MELKQKAEVKLAAIKDSLKERLSGPWRWTVSSFSSKRQGKAFLEEEQVISLQVGRSRWRVPRELRVELWLSALHRNNGTAWVDKYPTYLAQELPQLECNDIVKDIKRTFPSYERFHTETGQAALRDVLHAYAAFDPEVAYCQGMNFLAGLLLLYMPSEAHAFAGLVVLMQERNLRKFYSRSMSLLQVQLWQLGKLMSPKLCQHMESCGVTPVLYGASWLMTCFSADFPVSFSARILDVMLADRCDFALLKVAVCILNSCDRKLRLKSDLEDILGCLKLEVPSWGEQYLDDVLSEAFGKPWTPRQLAVLRSHENAETVSQAMERVMALTNDGGPEGQAQEIDDEGEVACSGNDEQALPESLVNSSTNISAPAAVNIPALHPPPSASSSMLTSGYASPRVSSPLTTPREKTGCRYTTPLLRSQEVAAAHGCGSSSIRTPGTAPQDASESDTDAEAVQECIEDWDAYWVAANEQDGQEAGLHLAPCYQPIQPPHPTELNAGAHHRAQSAGPLHMASHVPYQQQRSMAWAVPNDRTSPVIDEFWKLHKQHAPARPAAAKGFSSHKGQQHFPQPPHAVCQQPLQYVAHTSTYMPLSVTLPTVAGPAAAAEHSAAVAILQGCGGSSTALQQRTEFGPCHERKLSRSVPGSFHLSAVEFTFSAAASLLPDHSTDMPSFIREMNVSIAAATVADANCQVSWGLNQNAPWLAVDIANVAPADSVQHCSEPSPAIADFPSAVFAADLELAASTEARVHDGHSTHQAVRSPGGTGCRGTGSGTVIAAGGCGMLQPATASCSHSILPVENMPIGSCTAADRGCGAAYAHLTGQSHPQKGGNKENAMYVQKAAVVIVAEPTTVHALLPCMDQLLAAVDWTTQGPATAAAAPPPPPPPPVAGRQLTKTTCADDATATATLDGTAAVAGDILRAMSQLDKERADAAYDPTQLMAETMYAHPHSNETQHFFSCPTSYPTRIHAAGDAAAAAAAESGCATSSSSVPTAPASQEQRAAPGSAAEHASHSTTMCQQESEPTIPGPQTGASGLTLQPSTSDSGCDSNSSFYSPQVPPRRLSLMVDGIAIFDPTSLMSPKSPGLLSGPSALLSICSRAGLAQQYDADPATIMQAATTNDERLAPAADEHLAAASNMQAAAADGQRASTSCTAATSAEMLVSIVAPPVLAGTGSPTISIQTADGQHGKELLQKACPAGSNTMAMKAAAAAAAAATQSMQHGVAAAPTAAVQPPAWLAVFPHAADIGHQASTSVEHHNNDCNPHGGAAASAEATQRWAAPSPSQLYWCPFEQPGVQLSQPSPSAAATDAAATVIGTPHASDVPLAQSLWIGQQLLATDACASPGCYSPSALPPLGQAAAARASKSSSSSRRTSMLDSQLLTCRPSEPGSVSSCTLSKWPSTDYEVPGTELLDSVTSCTWTPPLSAISSTHAIMADANVELEAAAEAVTGRNCLVPSGCCASACEGTCPRPSCSSAATSPGTDAHGTSCHSPADATSACEKSSWANDHVSTTATENTVGGWGSCNQDPWGIMQHAQSGEHVAGELGMHVSKTTPTENMVGGWGSCSLCDEPHKPVSRQLSLPVSTRILDVDIVHRMGSGQGSSIRFASSGGCARSRVLESSSIRAAVRGAVAGTPQPQAPIHARRHSAGPAAGEGAASAAIAAADKSSPKGTLNKRSSSCKQLQLGDLDSIMQAQMRLLRRTGP